MRQGRFKKSGWTSRRFELCEGVFHRAAVDDWRSVDEQVVDRATKRREDLRREVGRVDAREPRSRREPSRLDGRRQVRGAVGSSRSPPSPPPCGSASIARPLGPSRRPDRGRCARPGCCGAPCPSDSASRVALTTEYSGLSVPPRGSSKATSSSSRNRCWGNRTRAASAGIGSCEPVLGEPCDRSRRSLRRLSWRSRGSRIGREAQRSWPVRVGPTPSLAASNRGT